MKNINKIVYYLLIASANIFLTTAQQFTIDLNKKSCAKEGIIEVELSGENPDSLGVLRYYQLNLPNYDKAVYYAQDTYYDYWQGTSLDIYTEYYWRFVCETCLWGRRSTKLGI